MSKTKAPPLAKQILVDCAMTIEQWAAKHGHPRGWFYDLKRIGRAPDTIDAGVGGQRITPAADRRWEAKMLRLAKGAKARREAERRSAMAAKAGKIAAASPKHIWQRRRAAKQAAE